MAKKTTSAQKVYTYRNGKKVTLTKQPDQFVVRKSIEEVEKMGIHGGESVSPHSTRVTVSRESLDPLMEDMRKDAVTHHAYTQDENNAEFLVTDRIIVTFKAAATDDQLNTFIAKYGLLLLEKYSEREFLFQLTNQTNMNPLKLVVLINESEGELIEACEHDLNKRMKKTNVNIPTDAKYQQQWHLHTRLTHTQFDARSSAQCENAWHTLNHYGSPDVVIGVTDDGCKLDHADFDSPSKFAQWGYMSGSTLVNRDSVSANPANMYQNLADHGTSCCGVTAAEIDGLLTVGASPGCKLLPIKWQSTGPSLSISDSKLMTVLNFISDKVDVLSNSWGSTPESIWAINIVTKITQLAQTGGRRGKGIVFLWAAGNENCPIQYTGTKDIPYDDGHDSNWNWQGVSTSRTFENNLVGIPGVMHIAALASNAQRSHYSNYGEGISLCAPSSNSHEYHRIMTLQGLGITTTTGKSALFTSSFGGTSSATPLTAGIAALVISANPNLTAFEVISILQKTASKTLNMAGYPKTPPASYDPNPTWDISPVSPYQTGNFNNINHPDGTWSGWFGFGKVDAAAAVAEALRLLTGPVVNGQVITQTASPNLAIPDNTASGISNTMVISQGGTIASVNVEVNLLHTYIGDLIVRLISPRGTPAILHDRNGGNTKNINKTFDVQNAPTLARCAGEPSDGNWTLEVIDAAAADIGILQSWTLHIHTGASTGIMLEESPGITIPDNNPAGIERKLNTTNTGTISEVKVEIDITHTYISDLIVNLVSPAGTVITLHNLSGGDSDNIIKTYQASNLPALSALQGGPIQGDWKLKVSDVAGQDVGKLNRWKVTIGQ
jgi:subtilisin-like proprotein convertase family protein/subtilisin family serine protease